MSTFAPTASKRAAHRWLSTSYLWETGSGQSPARVRPDSGRPSPVFGSMCPTLLLRVDDRAAPPPPPTLHFGSLISQCSVCMVVCFTTCALTRAVCWPRHLSHGLTPDVSPHAHTRAQDDRQRVDAAVCRHVSGVAQLVEVFGGHPRSAGERPEARSLHGRTRVFAGVPHMGRRAPRRTTQRQDHSEGSPRQR